LDDQTGRTSSASTGEKKMTKINIFFFLVLYILGTHADLLVVVFHKIITTGHQRLQPLFDCLLTILVNGKTLFFKKDLHQPWLYLAESTKL